MGPTITGSDANRRGHERAAGIIAVEFALTLIIFVAVVGIVGEFLRMSLLDQALARATTLGATAAGADSARCETAAREAFAEDALAAWLFDADDDGAIAFVSGTDPNVSGREVRLEVASDDGVINNGLAFEPLCGVEGSWIVVRASVAVRMRFGVGTILRDHASWARNQG